MNKRPVLLRTAIALIVTAVFTFSMYPLTQRDFYETFTKLLKDRKNPAAAELVTDARKMQEKNPELYPSQALLAAADTKGVSLKEMVKGEKLEDNRDVMSLVRKEASSSIRLGLDLNGGVEFVLHLIPDQDFLKRLEEIGKDGKSGKENREEVEARMDAEFNRYRDIAIEILRKRLEGQKIYEAEIAPSGSRYVTLKAPIVSKDEKLKLLNLISMSAKLRFRLVHPESAELVSRYLANPAAFQMPVGFELMETTEYRPGQAPEVRRYIVENRWVMDGKGVKYAYASRDQFGQRKIDLAFNPEGAQQFALVTKANVGRQLAIVLDGKLYCAPVIKTAIEGGNASIDGNFSDEECKNIADALVSGSFPFQIKVNAVFDTDPKLGADNVKNGIWVGVFSLLTVVVFMCGYYMLAGLVAVTALSVNVLLVLGAMAAFDATLTLPGIAGIVLTIGMAVDANVLIFERIREELKLGKSIANAIDLGYSRALSAVVDSNLTTLITSIILMWVGTGAVKGFAVTLSIGILTSLFTALFVTRIIFDWMLRSPKFVTLRMNQFFVSPNFNFPRAWKVAVPLSIAVSVLSIGLFLYKGSSVLGVDFTGGTQVTFDFKKAVSPAELERSLAAAGYQATVNYKYSAGGNEDGKVEILIRNDLTQKNSNPKDDLEAYLNGKFPDAKLSGGLESSVGGLIGREFSKAALLAVFLSMIGIGIYVTIRYELSYAIASLVALFHDVIVVMGIYVLMERTISLNVVAAVLTVIGYSMNDTVVVFDRIRENVNAKAGGTSYIEVINTSLNQTLSRTILTSLTTFLVVVVLYIWGGVAINDFVLIMMLGIMVGTYSSLFVASLFVAIWHKRVGRLDQAAPEPVEQP
ncbi:MAG: protein translocase subunit SecD [Victivallaceae bacterium]